VPAPLWAGVVFILSYFFIAYLLFHDHLLKPFPLLTYQISYG
jgi:hypothetical protein